MVGRSAVAIAPTVPRLWPGETVICLATGASLTPGDVAACRTRGHVLAIKDAVRLAPWAEVLWACDARWWRYYGDDLHFHGMRYALEVGAARWATVLRNTGETGLESDPSGLRTGRNSGYQAINLAVHLGAQRIVLLGYDMQRSADQRDHFFGEHPWHARPPYAAFRPFFETLTAPLQALGVTVVNATRDSALTTFPRVPLAEALA